MHTFLDPVMPTYTVTPDEKVIAARDNVARTYASGKTKDVAFRKQQLSRLVDMFTDNKQRLRNAAAVDLGRHMNETDYLEYIAVVNQALDAYTNVAEWTKSHVQTCLPSRSTSAVRYLDYKEPKGVVLIIGTFNYPVFCLAVPLIGAIAAGCTAIIRPSKMAPSTAALWTELLPKYLDAMAYTVVNCDSEGLSSILDLSWDHIFYTGSEREGRLVSEAAAKRLTPITLELASKSPAIVDKDCDLDAAAQSILWAKFVNAGQSYAAPDYVIVHREVHEKLLYALVDAYRQFFPAVGSELSQMAYLINARAYERLRDKLARTRGTIVLGGNMNPAKNWISTTVVDRCNFDDPLLEGEIFGPLLPIVEVQDVAEAVAHVRSSKGSRVCYIFSKSQETIDHVFSYTSIGTIVANECIVEAGVSWTLGQSRSSSAWDSLTSGKTAFDTFSFVRKGVYFPLGHGKFATLRYPPYTAEKVIEMHKILTRRLEQSRRLPTTPRPWRKYAAALSIAVAIAVVLLLPERRKAILR